MGCPFSAVRFAVNGEQLKYATSVGASNVLGSHQCRENAGLITVNLRSYLC
jgi:hypothetical protein